MTRLPPKNDRDPFTDPVADAHLRALKPRQRQFVELMVWSGLSHTGAAEKLRVPPRTARWWMRHAAILRAIQVENQVLRASARARNIHRLEELRDQNRNLAAAVAAARVIEDMGSEEGTRPPGQTVGWIIAIPAHQLQRLSPNSRQGIEDARIIDVTPRAEPTRSTHAVPAQGCDPTSGSDDE